MSHPNPNRPRRERGVVLVMGLVLLLILSIIGFSSMRTSITEQKTASNFQSAGISHAAAEEGASIVSKKLLGAECTLPCNYNTNIAANNGGFWTIESYSLPNPPNTPFTEVVIKGLVLDGANELSATRLKIKLVAEDEQVDAVFRASKAISIQSGTIQLTGNVASDISISVNNAALSFSDMTTYKGLLYTPSGGCATCGARFKELKQTPISVYSAAMAEAELVKTTPVAKCSSWGSAFWGTATAPNYYKCNGAVTVDNSMENMVIVGKSFTMLSNGSLSHKNITFISYGSFAFSRNQPASASFDASIIANGPITFTSTHNNGSPITIRGTISTLDTITVDNKITIFNLSPPVGYVPPPYQGKKQVVEWTVL